MPFPRRNFAGFTLIEVLVALAITSLIMTLLMGATYYVMQTRVKLIDEVRIGERHAREQLWFKQIVATLLPVTEETPGAFEGTELKFTSWQIRPLSADPAVAPEVATLALQNNKHISGYDLVYSTARDKMTLASWPESNAHFSYMNASGKILPVWNTQSQPIEHIPLAIQIEVKSSKDDALQDFWFAKTDSAPWLEKKQPPVFLIPGSS